MENYSYDVTLSDEDIEQSLQKIESELKISNNTEDMYKLLMNDNFFSEVNKLSNIVQNINFKTVNDIAKKNKICNSINSSDKLDKSNELRQIERILIMVNKYTIIMSQISQWIYINLRDIYQYCNNDPEKLNNIKQVIAKLSYVLANQFEMKNILSNNINILPPQKTDLSNKKNQYVSSGWMYATYALIIILIIMFIMIIYNQ